jgi:murein peptide amidase A
VWSPRLVLVVVLALLAGSSAAAMPKDPLGRRVTMLGRSSDGRPINAVELGDLDSPRTALVVGCIHGNECAGIAVADALSGSRLPREVDLWVIDDLNPDGHAAGTRQNAHGVDLNRNFPWRWRPLTGVYDSGVSPLSEPESRLAAELIDRVRPGVSVWFHQHLDVVDRSTGDIKIERRFARLAGMRLANLTREPGSAVTWESHCFPGGTAFVVELAAGPLNPRRTRRLARAVASSLNAAPERRPGRNTSCRLTR